MRARWIVAAAGLVAWACSPAPGAPDAGQGDAGSDAGVDAGSPDAGLDGGRDAGVDAGVDAGRPFDIYQLVPSDGGLPGCRACLDTGNCGATINLCANDPACVNGVGCTIVTCLAPIDGGAGLSPDASVTELLGCAVVCFDNDVVRTLSAAAALGCGAACAPTCGSELLGSFGDAGVAPAADGG